MQAPSSRLPPLVLAVLPAALLFLTRLDCPLLEPQEPRYAEIPRQMLAAGDLLSPTLNGQPYHDKPPLLYWLVMLAYAAFGVHDWAARLVPAAAGCLTVLATYLWGRSVLGPRGGLAGALVLALSARFVYLGRLLTFDTVLALFVTAALGAAHVALLGGRRRLWLLSAVACGLGVLTKGPVALVLVAVPVAVWGWWYGRLPRPGAVLGYLGVVLAVAAPWFVTMARQHPDFLHYFFWRHHVERFVTPFDHQEPFWFHLPGLVLGMLPWTLLLPGLVGRLRREGSEPGLGFFLIAAVWGVVFFSASGCKRAVYILPVLPPLALAMGAHLAAGGRAAWPWPVSSKVCAMATFAVLFIVLTFALPAYSNRFALRQTVQRLGQQAGDAPVVCYPRSWDSVGFYLGRPVQLYASEHRDRMLADLARARRTFLFVRSGRGEDEVRRELAGRATVRLFERKGSVTVLEVRRKRPPR